MNEIKTVFGFTVRSAVRKKPFKVTTIVLLALLLILCALPSLLSSDAETPPEETPADEKSYACYYIDPKGLIPGGRETLAALLPDAEVLDGDIARLDEYGLECDDNGATLVVEVVEREGAPFIHLYQGALSNPVGVVDAPKECWVAALLAENGVSEDVIALTAAQRMSAPGSAKPLCPLTVKPACRPFLTKNAACIIALERDAHDLQLGIRLSVADMLLLVLLGFITDNVDFFALAVLDDVRGHSTGHRRRADGKAGRRGDRKNLLEGVGVALVHIELFNEDDVAFADLVLLSARFNNRKHEKHLTFKCGI